MALLGEFTVKLVVGAHHGPGIGLLHGDLEALEVHFTQGTCVHAAVVLHTVHFLVVGGEVLDGNAHAVALDTLYISGAHLAGQEGILGEIFEVTAAEGIAVQVLTGGQENIGAVFLHFFTHGSG